jgi:F-type H+-transporting ATPase subunit epsilon
MQCDIVTQERTVFSEQVDAVNLPGIEGRLGILPNHTALLTALTFGEVYIRTGSETEYFAIGGGFAEVQPDHVIILADSAEAAEEIDIQRAEEARKRALKTMEEGVPEDMGRLQQIEASLRRAEVRINVAQRRSRRRRTTISEMASSEQD